MDLKTAEGILAIAIDQDALEAAIASTSDLIASGEAVEIPDPEAFELAKEMLLELDGAHAPFDAVFDFAIGPMGSEVEKSGKGIAALRKKYSAELNASISLLNALTNKYNALRAEKSTSLKRLTDAKASIISKLGLYPQEVKEGHKEALPE